MPYRANRIGFDHRVTTTGYRAVHLWMNTHFPKVGRCEMCGTRPQRTEWAATRYTHNRADWFELCVPCHKKFDLKMRDWTQPCERCGEVNWMPVISGRSRTRTMRCRTCWNRKEHERLRRKHAV